MKTIGLKTSTTLVTLSFRETAIGDQPFKIEKVVNDIGVQIDGKRRHVGDYITEAEASQLLFEPSLEVTTIQRK